METTNRIAWAEIFAKQTKEVQNGAYRVTLLGAFSSGKSTIINALLGYPLLPAEQEPTTASLTNICRGEKTSFFIELSPEDIEAIKPELRAWQQKHDPKGHFRIIDSLNYLGKKLRGIGAEWSTRAPGENQALAQVVRMLIMQKNREGAGSDELSQIKGFLKNNSNAMLTLTLREWPDELNDIVLTDVPGTGSIYKDHERVIHEIIPQSQLILYVQNVQEMDSALNEDFLSQISNQHRRKIFYLLSKVDLVNKTTREESLAKLLGNVPSVEKDGERPDFMAVAALAAMEAKLLQRGARHYNDIIEDEKLQLTKLVAKDAWHQANSEGKKQLMIEYLLECSQFQAFTDRITNYLHKENKELALADTALNHMDSFAKEFRQSCKERATLLENSFNMDELQNEWKAMKEEREELLKQAEKTIDTFRSRCSSKHTPIFTNLNNTLKEIEEKIFDTLDKKVTSSDKIDQYRKPHELDALISPIINAAHTCIHRYTMEQLSSECEMLDNDLNATVQKIQNNGLEARLLTGIQVDVKDINENNNTSLSGGEIIGGTIATTAAATGGLAALGVGVSTVGGFLGIGGTTVVFGLATAVFAPIAACAFIGGLVYAWHSNDKRYKKNREIFFNAIKNKICPDLSRKIRESVETHIRAIVEEICSSRKKVLDNILKEKKHDEQKLIDEMNKKQHEHQSSVDTLNQQADRVDELVKQAHQALNC